MPSAGLVSILSEPKHIKEVIKDVVAEFLEQTIYMREIDSKVKLALFYIQYIKPGFNQELSNYGFSLTELAQHLKSKQCYPLEMLANFIESDSPNQAWSKRYGISLN